MKIVKKENITFEEIKSCLDQGGLVVLPFDTCYGLVCDPTNQRAVNKLLEYKSRREGRAISVAVADIAMIKPYVELNSTALRFAERFLPGPFTIVIKSKSRFASGIEAENHTVGVRIPNNKWLLEFSRFYGKPFTSTSANQSYKKTPYKVEDITEIPSTKALGLIDLFIDGGKLPYNPPSTVVDTSNQDIRMLRKGSIIPENVQLNEVRSHCVEETIECGYNLMRQYEKELLHRPVIFALQGDMGTGKTHFTKGIAQFLGISSVIQSPTFIIAMEYKSPKGNMLYHIDTWRLELEDGFNELNELGFKKMLETKEKSLGNVIVIEWADKIFEYLNTLNANYKIIWVEIILGESESERIIKWSE